MKRQSLTLPWDGDLAWKRMTGEFFKGKATPFEAKAFFKPTDTPEKPYSGRFDPKGVPGVYLRKITVRERDSTKCGT